MHVAVIGANGYFGKNLVNYLQYKYSIDVDCYDNVEDVSAVNCRCVDITNKEAVKDKRM